MLLGAMILLRKLHIVIAVRKLIRHMLKTDQY
jgi:hypothetical protein